MLVYSCVKFKCLVDLEVLKDDEQRFYSSMVIAGSMMNLVIECFLMMTCFETCSAMELPVLMSWIRLVKMMGLGKRNG
ncbi:Uncharacterized protein TCM_023848 [Theobroma cacao]|uniref:Uncharacterized protein n=1 Tax=Theobroma cacao TaxID=3641 RepID=A0A061EVB8_THECC|nr:Uncharacterized protein TCM_023848 [Theobroma cacao]